MKGIFVIGRPNLLPSERLLGNSVPRCQDGDPVRGGVGGQHQHAATREVATTTQRVTARGSGPSTARRALPCQALHPPPSPGEFSDSSRATSTHRLYVFVSPKSFSAFDYIPVFLPKELSLADHGPAKRRRRARACGATRRMRTADRPRGSCVLQVSVVDEKVPQSK